MADESYGSVGTPRIYVDYVQYAKAIGMVDFFYYNDTELECSNPEGLWDFNPSNEVRFTITTVKSEYYFQAHFKDNIQFKNLVSTTNYGALLGHNVGSLGADRYVESRIRGGYSSHTSILGSDGKLRRQVGTNIWKINQFQGSFGDMFAHYDELGFKIMDGTAENTFNVGDVFNFNAYSIGRYFDLPHSANLSLNQTISYDGVQTKRTIGGSDLTQVNYLRPKFGDYTPFQNIDLLGSTDYQQVINDNDFSTAGFQGRRSWDLSFSYISKEDMFPRSYSNNTAGYYDYDDTQEFDDGGNSTGLYTDNVVNNWLNLTLGGQIPFIFQPDKDKPTDFAIVKMDKNSLQITQQAPMLYQFKVKLVEQF